MWLPDGEKNFEDMLIHFDTVHERDGRTDRQTDTARRHRPRLCIASRGKNVPTCVCDIRRVLISVESLYTSVMYLWYKLSLS